MGLIGISGSQQRFRAAVLMTLVAVSLSSFQSLSLVATESSGVDSIGNTPGHSPRHSAGAVHVRVDFSAADLCEERNSEESEEKFRECGKSDESNVLAKRPSFRTVLDRHSHCAGTPSSQERLIALGHLTI